MKRVLLMVLLLAVLLTGCMTLPAPALQTQEQNPPMAENVMAQEPTQKETAPVTTEIPSLEETEPVAALLQSMTLEEKVGQLFLARCPDINAVEDLQQYHLGGYILFGRDFDGKTEEEITAQVQRYQESVRIPLIIGVDEEGGTVSRVSALRDAPFLSARELFTQGGMTVIVEDTAEKDRLLHSLGINVNFAPVADVSTNPEDFIYERAFGQDAAATADYTAQVIGQMTKDNMGSCLKHFPGYGSNVDTHTGIAVDTRPMATFLEEDLLPFRSYSAGEGKTAIMVSHNIICCIDPERPASLSGKVIAFLRQILGYDGVVMTDGLDMGAVLEYTDGGNIAVTALLAGNDILLICDYAEGIPAILNAVEEGTVTEEMIDTACCRVLTWKYNLGLI